jgi:hypothetical protein|tara:strand:+ start:442 stop:606 length:165 start_codon:yes stop_codon:yes gene_type:complete
MKFDRDKRNGLTLFEYAEKVLNKLTDEERDRVRRYLQYKFKHRKNKTKRNNTYA